MNIDQKYKALLHEAQKHQLPDIAAIQLCFMALSLASRIDRDCAQQLACYGLSEGRFIILFLLNAANEGIAPKVLAQQAGITRATVTGLLDGLERDALIERHLDLNDRRALKIQLTAKGKLIATDAFTQHSNWISQRFGHLTAQERQQLMQLLEKVSNQLTP
ncbi:MULTISPECIES: MarR family transcriptional regulator [unclassified Acinetobacter]|uniref:MarR family winged helix-turn-helix transcriptional regulator n=1 Tax=unclassified Acinetobacter TaxID=196816 RepID=UPI0029349FFA|nr:MULTISPECIES: MarR family transcriptional regulator [unclassified Acinetobacter]WOE32483.1 MarR family transcriptional regulator [Acinetobacter sp. SAAs470]WOE37959.1 MarR family transcriptional regulator [Acinetobacter sp. SAAs474]